MFPLNWSYNFLCFRYNSTYPSTYTSILGWRREIHWTNWLLRLSGKIAYRFSDLHSENYSWNRPNHYFQSYSTYTWLKILITQPIYNIFANISLLGEHRIELSSVEGKANYLLIFSEIALVRLANQLWQISLELSILAHFHFNAARLANLFFFKCLWNDLDWLPTNVLASYCFVLV